MPRSSGPVTVHAMPVGVAPAIILTTGAAVATVLAAFAVLVLTRLIVRFAAEPDRRVRAPGPAHPRGLERDR
jgi:hypothetical protein